MSRRSRPAWLSSVLLGLLAVLLLVMWLGHEHVKHLPVATRSKPPAVVYEEPGSKGIEAPPAARHKPLAGHHGIALILDDVGYDIPALRRALALHIPIDISVLPDAPHAVEAAKLAHAAGEPVMLHMGLARHRGTGMGDRPVPGRHLDQDPAHSAGRHRPGGTAGRISNSRVQLWRDRQAGTSEFMKSAPS